MATQFVTVQAQKFKLAGSGITSSAVSIILQTFKTPAGTNIVTADFGALGYIVIDPGTSKEEVISFTTVTQNANGTATLSGAVRGLGFTTPYAETSANKLSHSGGAIVVLSNPGVFYDKFGVKSNDETITGYWKVPTPLGATDVVNKAYADALAMTGTGVSTDSIKVAGTAGETVVAGELLYLNTADARWWKTDADLTATVDSVQLGLAQGSGTAGNPITGGVLIRGVDSNQTGLVAGTTYYASNTAGAISATAGTIPRVIGNARSTTSLYFDSNFQNVLNNYAVDAVGTDSYAVNLPSFYSNYFSGMVVNFIAGTVNTGACTLNVNSAGAKTIKRIGTIDLETGDIPAGKICTVIYDGTNFQLTNQNTLPIVRTYNLADSPATWTKQKGLGYIDVKLWGGGGGGGSGDDGGGGGGGGYKELRIQASALGATEVVTVAAGGIVGVANSSGSAGGNSTFGSHTTAYGGGGGGGAPGGGGGVSAGGGGGGTTTAGSDGTSTGGVG